MRTEATGSSRGIGQQASEVADQVGHTAKQKTNELKDWNQDTFESTKDGAGKLGQHVQHNVANAKDTAGNKAKEAHEAGVDQGKSISNGLSQAAESTKGFLDRAKEKIVG